MSQFGRGINRPETIRFLSVRPGVTISLDGKCNLF